MRIIHGPQTWDQHSVSFPPFCFFLSRVLPEKNGWVTVAVLLWKAIVTYIFLPFSPGSLISFSLFLPFLPLFYLLFLIHFSTGARFIPGVKRCVRSVSWDLTGSCGLDKQKQKNSDTADDGIGQEHWCFKHSYETNCLLFCVLLQFCPHCTFLPQTNILLHARSPLPYFRNCCQEKSERCRNKTWPISRLDLKAFFLPHGYFMKEKKEGALCGHMWECVCLGESVGGIRIECMS